MANPKFLVTINGGDPIEVELNDEQEHWASVRVNYVDEDGQNWSLVAVDDYYSARRGNVDPTIEAAPATVYLALGHGHPVLIRHFTIPEVPSPEAELSSTYVSVSGKTVEQWKVTGAADLDEAAAAVPGDFIIHGHVTVDGVFYVDAIRHF